MFVPARSHAVRHGLDVCWILALKTPFAKPNSPKSQGIQTFQVGDETEQLQEDIAYKVCH